MASYIARRLLLSIPTLFLVLLATFVLVRLTPGDPAGAYLAEVRVTASRLQETRHRLGLDQPLLVQFAYYGGRVLAGNLGYSYFTRQPVAETILEKLPYTLELALAATLLSIVVGLPLGVYAGVRRNTAADYVVSTAAVVGYSMPRFWVGLLLILVFALKLPWFPVIGVGEGSAASLLYHLVLPTLAVGISRIALLARMTRSTVLDVMGQDFIRTARSKGLPETAVLFRHALRNALIPVLTVVGLGFGHLVGGAIVVETVFVRAGLGTLLVEAIRARDYPLIQGGLLVFAIGIVLVNIVVDVSYAVIDPRIRYA